MELIETGFDGMYVLQTVHFEDQRGGFQKVFNFDFFNENGLDADFKEFYYSVNKKNVRRGMHFQLPPFEHTKLVWVSAGRILDVCVDIRKASATFGKCFSIELNSMTGKYLYIPKGFAHGFLSLEDGSICNYAQTSVYNRECDNGIDQQSIEFKWPVDNPIVSERDLTFPTLQDFVSPF